MPFGVRKPPKHEPAGLRQLSMGISAFGRFEPAFIRMREQVLADILTRDAPAGAFDGGPA
jgi:hypothetical protein